VNNLYKLLDNIISLGINVFIFGLWAYKMLLTSEISVEISADDTMKISFLLILSLIIYSIYIRKTKYILKNLVLVLPTLTLWFASMLHALMYNYHKNDTLVSVIGFSTTIIILLQMIYRWLKYKKIVEKSI